MRCRFFSFFLDKKELIGKQKIECRQQVVLEMAEIEGQKVYETTRKLIG
jgi:hypothetical protein